MQLTIIGALIVAIIASAFAMQNNVPVTVTFLVWRFDSSLAMVLLISLAMGATIVALLSTPVTVKRQWQLRRQKRRIEDLEKIEEELRRSISELERVAPADTTVPEERLYVGLTQIVTGHAADTPKGN